MLDRCSLDARYLFLRCSITFTRTSMDFRPPCEICVPNANRCTRRLCLFHHCTPHPPYEMCMPNIAPDGMCAPRLHAPPARCNGRARTPTHTLHLPLQRAGCTHQKTPSMAVQDPRASCRATHERNDTISQLGSPSRGGYFSWGVGPPHHFWWGEQRGKHRALSPTSLPSSLSWPSWLAF